jgi:hypothetical protein
MVPSIETLAEGFMGLEQAFKKDSRPHFCAHSLIRSPNAFHFLNLFSRTYLHYFFVSFNLVICQNFAHIVLRNFPILDSGKL